MTGLPKGWTEASLGEIAATSLGKMLDAKQRTGLHQTPYLRNVNVRWGAFDLSDIAAMDIEPRELDRVLAQPGDLVACEGGEPGRSAVWRGREPVALQKALHKIRPAVGVLPDYLALLLREQSSTGELKKLFTGTTIKHLPQEKLRLVRVPLAPTAEQARIVAAIEEAFSKLDAGEAGLRTVRQLLKRMRDAILAAAVTGRLVPQDPTDTPATKVLADLGVEAVIDECAPATWAAARLAELASLVTDGDHRPPKRVPSGIPHLTAKNVRGGRFDLAGCSFVDDPGFAQTRSRYEPIAGDLIVTCVGTIGRVAVVPNGLTFSADRNLAAVRLKPVVEPHFAELALASPAIQDWMAEASGSTAQPHLYLRDLRSIVVPVPPVEEQHRIVTEVERQFSFLDACERAVDTGLARAAATRRSVLKAAFEGRLVPQDPTDEPASVLLDRIREQRAAAPKAARRSRRTA